MFKYTLIILCSIFISLEIFASGYDVYNSAEYSFKKYNSKERILFIIDYSNSMWEYINGKSKVALVVETMQRILPTINKRQEIGLRVYGHRAGITAFDGCRASSLVAPIVQGNAFQIEQYLKKLSPRGMTPITYSLKQAISKDFADYTGMKHIILLTDGGENCDESPCEYAMNVVKTHQNVKIDVIAFNINNKNDLEQLKCTALVTSGKLYSANTQAELLNSLNKSLNIQKEVEAKIVPNY